MRYINLRLLTYLLTRIKLEYIYKTKSSALLPELTKWKSDPIISLTALQPYTATATSATTITSMARSSNGLSTKTLGIAWIGFLQAGFPSDTKMTVYMLLEWELLQPHRCTHSNYRASNDSCIVTFLVHITQESVIRTRLFAKNIQR